MGLRTVSLLISQSQDIISIDKLYAQPKSGILTVIKDNISRGKNVIETNFVRVMYSKGEKKHDFVFYPNVEVTERHH